jgi:hypothetical protein
MPGGLLRPSLYRVLTDPRLFSQANHFLKTHNIGYTAPLAPTNFASEAESVSTRFLNH